MKKGLSILLIVAALFGFYGGAVNLVDILACKDYWEEEGRKTTEDLNTLEDGLNKLSENEQAYLDGRAQLADAAVALADGEKTLADGQNQYNAGLAEYNKGKSDLKNGKNSKSLLEKMLAGCDQIPAGYNEKNTGWKDGYEALKEGRTKLKAGVSGALPSLVQAAYFLDETDQPGYVTALTAEEIDSGDDSVNGYKTWNDNLNKLGSYYDKLITGIGVKLTKAKSLQSDLNNSERNKQAFKTVVNDNKVTLQDLAASISGETKQNYLIAVSDIGDVSDEKRTNVMNGINAIVTALSTTKAGFESTNTDTPGYLFASISGAQDGYAGLAAGQDEIGNIVQTIMYQLTNDSTLKPVTKANVTAEAFSVMEQMGNTDMTSKSKSFKDFATEMGNANAYLQSAAKPVLTGVIAAASKTIAEGEKKLSDAEGQLADAKKQLDQGAADLADGKAQYADGLKQLAEYEDGEQQIRDGLASLFAAEANGGLESIASRLNNDGNFDDETGHLMIKRGLEGVGAGRAYSDDSGVVITKEITQRAVGTVAGFVGALLAIIAAILSFLKKNKGAGVFSALTAVCGVAGIAVAKSAGVEFSQLAGSALSAVPYVAFGVLAVVAVVHCITHFGAKAA